MLEVEHFLQTLHQRHRFATLEHLKSNKSIYKKINDLGNYARKELTKIFDGNVEWLEKDHYSWHIS